MKFRYVIYKNVMKSIKDYKLYFLSIVLLTMLLFAANIFSYLVQLKYKAISNSLPFIMFLAMLFLTIFINDYMIRQRSKEFSIYLLCGITKNQITSLYITQVFLVSIIAFGVGIPLGDLMWKAINSTALKGYFSTENISYINSFTQTSIQFFAIQVITYIFTAIKNYKSTIFSLLISKKSNEKPIKLKNKKIHYLALILTIIILIYDFLHLKSNFTGVTVFIALLCFLYEGYSLLLAHLCRLRESQKVFFHEK